MFNVKRRAHDAARAAGAVIETNWDGRDGIDVTCDAPPGKCFAAVPGTHCVVASMSGGQIIEAGGLRAARDLVWCSILDDIAHGFDDCKDDDCDVCAEGRS